MCVLGGGVSHSLAHFSDPPMERRAHTLGSHWKMKITEFRCKGGGGGSTRCEEIHDHTRLPNQAVFVSTCSIIADLGSKLHIEKSVIKDGLTNSEYDEHARISWKYGCSSKCI